MLSLRLRVLLALVCQTSLQALLISYSKSVLHEKYNSATVIFLIESAKVIVSYVLMMRETSSVGKSPDVVTLLANSAPMSVPAIIYFIQNSLVYIVLSNITPQVYSTLIQLKLLTAAVISTLLLGRKYSLKKWRALLVLTIGVVLVQSNSFSGCADTQVEVDDESDPMLGFALTVIVSCLSSLAGVYTEKVLKKNDSLVTEQVSLWGRNIQLGVYSMAFAALKLTMEGNTDIFQGFSIVTLIIIASEAARGLTVALVLKHADTVLKGFATSCAIVLTTLCSWLLFSSDIQLTFVLGATNVIISIFLYNE